MLVYGQLSIWLSLILAASPQAWRVRIQDAFLTKEPNDAPVASREGRNGVFTIMNANTFLLDVRIMGEALTFGAKPDMDTRSRKLAEWFNSLQPEDVPDVLVLNECFSKASSRMLKLMCHENYKRVGLNSSGIIPCRSGSNFGFATKVLAGRGGKGTISGGVAILVRAGLEISELIEKYFSISNSHGEDRLSYKGFLRVKVTKTGSTWGGHRDIYVIGTHTQAWPAPVKVEVRKRQFAQMWRHVSKHISPGTPVVFAGDMNVEPREVDSMKEILHASNSGFRENGFWLHLREAHPWSSYAGGAFNAYLHYDPGESRAKSPHDQILFVTEDGYPQPSSMQWQYVPMKSPDCFDSNLKTTRPIQIDDLSDHYAAYAELCFDPEQCQQRELEGHRGWTRIGQEGEKQCCPGRKMLDGKCFDWYETEEGLGRPIGVIDNCCHKAYKTTYCIIEDAGEPVCGAHMTIETCHQILARIDLPLDQLKCFRAARASTATFSNNTEIGLGAAAAALDGF